MQLTDMSFFLFFFNHTATREIYTLSPHDSLLFFFNDTATTEIYTLSLHDALPISSRRRHTRLVSDWSSDVCSSDQIGRATSELQSLTNLVCRLLLGEIGRAHV